MEKTLAQTCLQLGAKLLEFGGEEDHIHLMISMPPTIPLCRLVGRLKGSSSYVIRKKFGALLRKKLWGNHLWSPSYSVVSCGGASLEVIKQYISNQRAPSSEERSKKFLPRKKEKQIIKEV